MDNASSKMDAVILERILMKIPDEERENMKKLFTGDIKLFQYFVNHWLNGIRSRKNMNNDDMASLKSKFREEITNTSEKENEIESFIDAHAEKRGITNKELYSGIGVSRDSFRNIKKGVSENKDAYLRLCFVLELEPEECSTLLDMTRHRLSVYDRRDYLIGKCLFNGVYSPDDADKCLMDNGLRPLFKNL